MAIKISGATIVDDNKLAQALTYSEITNPIAVPVGDGGISINCSLGNVFSMGLNANITSVTFTNVPSAYTLSLIVTPGIAQQTITWPSSVNWAGGIAPTLSVGTGLEDIFVLFTNNSGSTWYGFTAGQAMSVPA